MYSIIESHCDGACTVGHAEQKELAVSLAQEMADHYREKGLGPCRFTVFGPGPCTEQSIVTEIIVKKPAKEGDPCSTRSGHTR